MHCVDLTDLALFTVMHQLRAWLFLNYEQLSTVVDEGSCLPMNFLLFKTLGDFDLGDFGGDFDLDFDLGDFDMYHQKHRIYS